MEDEIYKEHILDHYRHPRHFGPLPGASVKLHTENPSCGDQETIYVRFDGDRILEASFEGEGCAISQAATSMLLEHAIGKTKEVIGKMTDANMKAMLGIEIGPSRERCANLGLQTLQDACIQKTHA